MNKEIKNLEAGHPMFDAIEKMRVRFVRMVDAVTVEVASNETGKVLPDWRHVSQVRPY